MNLNRELQRMGLGFLILLVDYSVRGIDLLPDFIGYILIAFALHRMKVVHSIFNKVSWLAVIMLFLYIPLMVVHRSQIKSEEIDLTAIPLQWLLYYTAFSILHVLLAYLIIYGLIILVKQGKRLAVPEWQPILLNRIYTVMILYLTANAAELVFFPFLIHLDSDWDSNFTVLMAVTFMVELIFIMLLFNCSKHFDQPVEAEELTS